MADWFDSARFGMFIHWGHVSQKGWELSWPLVGGNTVLPACQDVPAEVYYESAPTFAPQPGAPRRWLERAKRAGMRYAVFVAKHHDGFALYPTRAGDFSVAISRYRGDLVREYVEAARDLGLRVGLYFSLCDWHHPDYPPFTDADRPYRMGLAPRPTAEQWQRYLDFLFAQVRELLTEYGAIDVLWFDGGWERSFDEWRSKDLHDLIRSLQPDILINDRLPGYGDFDTPEQFVPPQPPARAWETCMTMNDTWGYSPSDTNYKSARELVHALCEVAGRGGNLLLNVSPTADGSLPPEQTERLDAVADWMAAYGASHPRHRPGPGAVAVLRPDHAPRPLPLPAPTAAPVRVRRCARTAGPARVRRARAAQWHRPGAPHALLHSRPAVQRRPRRRADRHRPREPPPPARHRARGRAGVKR